MTCGVSAGWNPWLRIWRQQMGPSRVWCLHPSARVAMQELAAELARVTDERRRLQRQAHKDRARHNKQRERALLVATIAFCHEPTAGHIFAEATLRKYARVFGEDVAKCTTEIEDRFLKTPVDTLAQWLDWSEDMPRGARAEAQRLVEDARCCAGWESRTARRESRLHPNLFGRSGAPWP